MLEQPICRGGGGGEAIIQTFQKTPEISKHIYSIRGTNNLCDIISIQPYQFINTQSSEKKTNFLLLLLLLEDMPWDIYVVNLKIWLFLT